MHELILERYCFVLGWITLSDIDVKEAGALPWSPELGRDKLLEIEYFISFSRILRHNVHFGHTGELSQLSFAFLQIQMPVFNLPGSIFYLGGFFSFSPTSNSF